MTNTKKTYIRLSSTGLNSNSIRLSNIQSSSMAALSRVEAIRKGLGIIKYAHAQEHAHGNEASTVLTCIGALAPVAAKPGSQMAVVSATRSLAVWPIPTIVAIAKPAKPTISARVQAVKSVRPAAVAAKPAVNANNDIPALPQPATSHWLAHLARSSHLGIPVDYWRDGLWPDDYDQDRLRRSTGPSHFWHA
jgi:hypothetical protein